MFARLVAVITAAVLVVGCSSSPPPTPTLTRTPTLTPAPLPTPIPTRAPGPTSMPLATASELGRAALSVSADQIGAHLDALMQVATANNGIRAAGTPGYDASVAYVAGQLTSLGYDVERDPFDFTFFDEAAPVQLAVGSDSWTGPEWLRAMIYSPPGDVTAPVQAVSIRNLYADGTAGCVATDWTGFSRGDIALIETGPCPRRDQIALAMSAGAVGVIALYPGWQANQTRRPILPPAGVTIPAIAAGAEPSAALLAAARDGGSAHIHVEVITRPATIDNVIAEWPGATSDLIMLGGHLDSVLDGPGIDDNGSGVATLLSLAASVAANPQPNKTVRFGIWGAEEDGFLGSQAYVASLDAGQIGQIGAYLNLDMVASPGSERLVYADPEAPPGSDQITQQLLAALAAAGKPGLAADESHESDHDTFALAGVPIGGVFSGINQMTEKEVAAFGGTVGVPADPCYHLSCDTRANINLDSAVILGDAAATVLQELAYQP